MTGKDKIPMELIADNGRNASRVMITLNVGTESICIEFEQGDMLKLLN
ncbi:MAG: hypothetical protein HKN87_21505 [Saprospiraceae bacterium]|nr:hypothetical protein [Saprospiraceae bacterium]